MRSSRMRGYGSWTIGWREGERNRGGPSGDNGGCLIVALPLIGLILFSAVKVSLETGNFLAILFGLAIIMGILSGLNKN